MNAATKALIFQQLHSASNCHQGVYGYFELNEHRKALLMAMECRGHWATIIGELEKLVNYEESTDPEDDR